jgi:hypothetical protein
VGFEPPTFNHPTPVILSEMFPDHAPSRKVTDPIFLGGPENREALFALVQRQGHADTGRIALASNLYLEIERKKRHYRWQSAVCGLAGRARVSLTRMKRYAGACGLHDRRNSATITP